MTQEPTSREAAPVVIGSWTADPEANELQRDGEILRLEPKTMAVLLALARRRGQVVTREQLLDEIWNGVIVGDASLTQTVIKLRKALGDTAQSPTYIETIPKRGYRLLPAIGQGHDASTTAAPPQGKHRRVLPAFLFVLVAGMLYALYGVGINQTSTSRGNDLAGERTGEPSPFDEARLAKLAETLPSISIRPFEAIGDDKSTMALARGLSWEIADRLSRLAELRVVASDGRDAAVDGQSLSRYLVLGSIGRTRQAVTVSVRLIERTSGIRIWSEQFEEASKDVLRVQEALVRNLVAALPVKVSEAEKQSLAKRMTKSMVAYETYLQAREAFLIRTAQDNARARDLFKAAVEHDPQFAQAYAGIGLTHIEDFRLWKDERRDESLASAARMAETAYQINPDSREAHWLRSYLALYESKYGEAAAYLRKALAIDGSYADAYALMAWIHIFEGNPARAVLMMRTAMRLNPGAGHIYFAHIGTAYYLQGDQEQALINLNEAKARNLADLSTHVWLGLALVAAGKSDESLWEADEVRMLRPAFSGKAWLARMPIKEAGHRDRIEAGLKTLNLW
ncbi:MAG: winged helix-turn-helix domain-containing protein [Betaproteobacteria bacterium]|nr:winged helix-turn-helix domain-containing protein [Betaproteobacteria bacterium]